jgi:hypothetical protein
MTRPTRADTTRAARYHELALNLRDLETDLRWGLADSPRIPQAWFEIATRPDVPAKSKLTLRIDDDVVAFFRATGRGHLSRMNAVLRSFMLARLAGVVTGAESVRYQPTLEEEEKSLRREILDTARAEFEAREAAEAARPEAEKRRARIEDLKRLRDARKRGA